jgi:inorganic pyrophosphatase
MKIDIFIENPAYTTLKKEFDEKSNKWTKVGHLAIPYPFPYGFIPKTQQKDGDPLDAFLITSTPGKFKRGDTVHCEILGLVEYFEDKERDFKVLVKKSQEKIELSSNIKKALKYFLIHAFDNKPNKTVEFGGFKGIKNTKEEINRCYEN